MEYVNLLRELASKYQISNQSPITNHQIRRVEWDEAIKTLAQLLAPFAPHVAEEIWVNILGKPFSIHTSSWPEYNPSLIKEEKRTIVIQVDGKLRSTLVLDSESGKNKDMVIEKAKTHQKVAKWLGGRRVIQMIFVENKLLNFVTK